MSLGISYMGTKRHLVPQLTEVVGDCRSGAFLDLFSGMCTVGRAVAPRRQVWSNDLQAFSNLVATTQFCSSDAPISRHEVPALVSSSLSENLNYLKGKFRSKIEAEKLALDCNDVARLAEIFDEGVVHAQSLAEPSTKLYDVFVQRYGGTYFSYEQAAEIDSIRYAIDMLRREGRLSLDRWRNLLVALCGAMARCSNSTGHFAQALYPKASNVKKVVGQRRRSVRAEWFDAVERITPIGAKSWRVRNRCYQSDAIDLLNALQDEKVTPSVIYADPPYTQDQYSRYYHLYETAVLYDYPTCKGQGLYRPGRVSSPFSLRSKVEESLEELVAAASRLRCSLVLSYPTSGLLENSDQLIPRMMQRHFGKVPKRTELPHLHSTMGGSKGATSHDVTEVIYQVDP